MVRHRDQLARSLLLAVASVLVTTALLEAALRVVAWRTDERALLAATSAPPPSPGRSVRLGEILRPSPDPRIVFELYPHLSVRFLGQLLVTDERGFRISPETRAPRAPLVRLVGLGDSVMFGWGVNASETYLSRLAGTLNERWAAAGWTALNTAVPGYNTVMEVQTLEVKALEPPPDLVLLNFVGNDLRLPNFVLERRSYLSPGRSFLLDFVRSRLEPDGGDLTPRLTYLPRQDRPSEAERVPRALRGLVGLGAFEDALDGLETLARHHGFPVVVLAHPVAPDFVRQGAEKRGFLLVETGARVRELAVERGLGGDWEPPLSLTDADPHPSALGHELIGEALLQALEASGLPERLAARAIRETASPSP